MSTDSQVSEGATKSTEPEPFHARSLAASLTVKDLQKSLSWYLDVMGFTVYQKYEREGKLMGVVVQAGDVRLLLGQDDGAKGWDRIKGEGFSLLLTTDQNVDEIASRIKERGGTLQSEPADMPWGARAFRFEDPDGYRFSISSVPAG